MKEVRINSWSDFENQIFMLFGTGDSRKGTITRSSAALFRGQSDSEWHLESTLERYVNSNKIPITQYYQIIHNAKSRIENKNIGKWNIPTISDYEEYLKTSTSGIADSEYRDYMVVLRHHGFPSPLLDWTFSSDVAAFFAFRNRRADKVAIFVYIECIFPGKSGRSYEPNIAIFDSPLKATTSRHLKQQSAYTICSMKDSKNQSYYSSHENVFIRNERDQDLLWKFILPASERLGVLKHLNTKGINAYALFDSTESLMETIAFEEVHEKAFLK
ncbi:MAG: FRG domain-containing protein [Proteobacteria bacterium]|nr:FRG domain-containing protein [Pseudomonadota bacterium]